MRLLFVVLMVSLALGAGTVSAKQLEGGVSMGKPSGVVVQPSSKALDRSSESATPAIDGGFLVGGRSWAGVAGGLATGLGFVWLASTLGLGEAAASLLLIGFLVFAVLVVFGWWVRLWWRGNGSLTVGSSGLAYQAVGRAVPREYSPQNVGNDASARPWERSTIGFDASRFSEVVQAGETLPADVTGVPPGFDVKTFLQASKANFISLQAAWDRSDVPSLRAMMTDDMLSQIQVQLAEREQFSGVSTNVVSEVVMVEARLLGLEELPHAHMACVEFSGLIREDGCPGPSPFREIWNITRPKSGPGGWLVAGVQALQ